MFFTGFGQNAYPMIPTYSIYDFYTNYQIPMADFVTTVPQHF